MLKSFKTKLNLNNQQPTLASKHAGVARHAWNWGLDICLKAKEAKEKLPTAIDLHKRLVAEVKSVNPWYYEVSKCAPQEALRHLQKAFQHWFKVPGRGKPRFKKKNIKDSFYLEGSIKISGNKIKLPRIGWVNCCEILPTVQPKNVTISKRANDWYVSFKYELEPKPIPKIGQRIGVDIGINTLATCSDGTVFPNQKAYRKAKRKLAHLQRSVCRKQLGSVNHTKANLKVARLLSKRTFKCGNCGAEIDRDLNASRNLENWHALIDYPLTVCSTGLACGESDKLNGTAVKDSTKQEANMEFTQGKMSLFDLGRFE